MRTITVDVFNFSELSEDAKKVALSKVRERFLNSEDFDFSEYKASLNAFAADLRLDIENWSYGLDGCSVEFDFEDSSVESLSGTRLYAWIANNVKGLQPGPKVYTVARETVRHGFKQTEHIVKRVSRVYKASDCCNYTGVCFDETLLQPFREFMKAPKDDINLHDLVSAAIDKYCDSMLSDLEYQETDEYTAEYIECNGDDLEFTACGKIYE